MAHELTDDAWVLLSWFSLIGWDSSSLPELRRLGEGKPEKIPELTEALQLLAELGLVEIWRTNDDRLGETLVKDDAVEVVIRDRANWTLPGEPGFDPTTYYTAIPTGEAEQLYLAEYEAGRPLLPSDNLIL